MPAGLREAFLVFAAELLEDKTCPNVEGIRTCDTTCTDVLIQAARLLGDDRPLSSRQDACASLSELAKQAHASMTSCAKEGIWGWRRIYTDACVLLAYADVSEYWATVDARHARSAVAHLDHAIVIAGAAGDGRLDLILDLIEHIQSECLNSPTSLRRDLSFISPMDTAPKPAIECPPTAARSVPRFETPPSLASFISRLSRQPFVLPGFLKDWLALNEHPWKSLDYLRAVGGPGRVVPVEVGEDYRSDDWTQKMMPWEEFLDSLGSPPSSEPQPVLYLAQHSLFKQFPALQGDIIVPDYVYSSLDPPENYPQYRPPGNEEQLVLNAWLGPAGTVSPAHTDPFFNFYAQVVGRKTIWLAPPEFSRHMYPYPSQTSPQPSRSADAPRNPAANHESPSMSNTTRVDVFVSSPEELELSRSMFPEFWADVVPSAMSVTLEPGDLLFFPPGWWHAMRSEETSFSVSMWF